jgi:hypothetical protein
MGVVHLLFFFCLFSTEMGVVHHFFFFFFCLFSTEMGVVYFFFFFFSTKMCVVRIK